MSLYKTFGPDHHYVSAKAPALTLPPPPAPGSPEDKADMKTLLDWQARRSEADCRAAVAQKDASFEEFFGDLKPFPEPESPEAKTLLFRVFFDTDKIVSAEKDRYPRPRPFLENGELEPCLGRIPENAYPSGHAVLSRVYALLLSDLAPERAAEFIARGDRDALNRVIGGVHHPSDIEAGKLLGSEIYAEMKKNPDFIKDLGKVKAQLR